MPPKKMSGKSIWGVCLTVAALAVVLIVLFATKILGNSSESIVLPSPAVEIPVQQQPAVQQKEDFLNVTNDNVLTALSSISRPTSYHQVYTVTVGADDRQAVKTVALWRNGDLLRAESTLGQQTRILISDGRTAYLWYAGSTATLSIRLTEELQEEDLLNLPDFDAFLTISEDAVVDSDYLVLEDSAVQCIYVCTQEKGGDTTRHWVSLETGLLYQSDVLENSNQVYAIRQTAYEQLAAEDESFLDRFLLPNGSAPFTAVSEMPPA